MDAHVGIVAEVLDQVAEGFLAERDILVVGVVVTAKDKIYRLELKLFLQFKLEVKRVERVLSLTAKHLVAFTHLFTIVGGKVLDEAAHGAIQPFVLVGPSRIYVVSRDKIELRLFDSEVGIGRLKPLSQSQSPDVDQRLLQHAILKHPCRLGLETAIFVAHLRKVLFVT